MSNARLKAAKNPSSSPFLRSPGSLSSDALRAGLRVRALIEEIATEIAIVIANCW